MASAVSLTYIEINDEETIPTFKKLSKSSFPTNYIEKICYAYILSNEEFEISLWYQESFEYLKFGHIPLELQALDQKNEKNRLKKHASKYVIIGSILYRRSFHDTLLRCLHHKEIEISLEKAHEGICGGHFNGIFIYQMLLGWGIIGLLWNKIIFNM